MNSTTWSERLWGKQAKLSYLLIAAAILLFTLLGARELWTQEHRWADIVSGMFFRHDFLHPYLGENDYYDKPLLSYWLIAAIASITDQVSTWALRFPSALAGFIAIGSIYRLGVQIKDKRLGLIAGWMLLTTFYFLFWAKTSSADMLNMAGTLLAVAWYAEKREQPSYLNYAIFFVIVAITSLCKGLVGAVVPALVILPDVILRKSWKTYLKPVFFLSMIPAAIIYYIPFWLSNHFGGNNYGQDGLYLVYRENILRYFQPFDHKGPIYTYFIFLPIYLMPWAFFFIPALAQVKTRWQSLSLNTKWMWWAVLVLFAFFTLSGSRRNYYVLPLVPFAILVTADWIAAGTEKFKRNIWAGRVAVLFFLAMFINFDVAQPLYYAKGGLNHFAYDVKAAANLTKPWSQWDFVMLDPESKVRFYLELSPHVKNYAAVGNRTSITADALQQAWPILKEQPKDVIIISRKRYEALLKEQLKNYKIVEARASLGERLLKINNLNAPVAFIPG